MTRSYDKGLYSTKLTPSENISRMSDCSATTTAKVDSLAREEWHSRTMETTSGFCLQSMTSRS